MKWALTHTMESTKRDDDSQTVVFTDGSEISWASEYDKGYRLFG